MDNPLRLSYVSASYKNRPISRITATMNSKTTMIADSRFIRLLLISVERDYCMPCLYMPISKQLIVKLSASHPSTKALIGTTRNQLGLEICGGTTALTM